MSQQEPILSYATPAPRRVRTTMIWLIVLTAGFMVMVGTLAFLGSRAVAVRRQVAAMQAAAMARAAMLPTTPSRLTLLQRTSKPLPGTSGIIARIGDITGGQTTFGLRGQAGNILINDVSLREGDVQAFSIAGEPFAIELTELKNLLTGDDFAVFTIRAAAVALTEDQKIRQLIDAVAAAEGITFIRNGKDHSAADAAAHLKGKYESVGNQDLTAQQFVDDIASRSSVSGEPYRIRLPDGTEQTSQAWLTARLREMQSDNRATPAAK